MKTSALFLFKILVSKIFEESIFSCVLKSDHLHWTSFVIERCLFSLCFFSHRKLAGLLKRRRRADPEAASAGGHGSTGEVRVEQHVMDKSEAFSSTADVSMFGFSSCEDCSWDGIHRADELHPS